MLVAERLKAARLSSGDLLREAARRGDPIGRELAQVMQTGALVPDELVTRLILVHLELLEEGRSFVLDGFPRTVDQARSLDETLTAQGRRPMDLAVDFEMSAEKVIERLAGRRVCGSCGANYHLVTLPPRQPGRCDRCGAQIRMREDDEPETIRKRLGVYHRQTEPLLAFYRRQGKLRSLSGELGIEEQYRALLALLKAEGLAS